MSSLNKNSFTINFVSKLDKSLGYALVRAVMEIPFWAILFFGSYGIINLSMVSEPWLMLSPLLLFVTKAH